MSLYGAFSINLDNIRGWSIKKLHKNSIRIIYSNMNGFIIVAKMDY
jgi:hypothetical protein